jgi:hypothetical protein
MRTVAWCTSCGRLTAGVFATPGTGGGEEMRGPHAALAARLAQRDPGRSFVLGAPLLRLASE